MYASIAAAKKGARIGDSIHNSMLNPNAASSMTATFQLSHDGMDESSARRRARKRNKNAGTNDAFFGGRWSGISSKIALCLVGVRPC